MAARIIAEAKRTRLTLAGFKVHRRKYGRNKF
jgi:hypothetical protein